MLVDLIRQYLGGLEMETSIITASSGLRFC
jgi:hypothetical protein